MSNPAKLECIEIEAETNFGEATSTFGTLRLPYIGTIDMSGFTHPKIDSGHANQYRQEQTDYILGIKGVTFKTKFHWFGHGSSTLSATTVSAFETFLSSILGGTPTVSAASGTTAGAAGSASVPTTVASGTYASGALARFGVKGDGRADGQLGAISTHITTNMTLFTALPVAMNSGDVISSGVNWYPNETPTSTSVTSYRMRFLTANQRAEAHGCFPTAITFSDFNPGSMPTVEITWQGAYWNPIGSGATFPSTLTTDASLPGPLAGGSLHFQTFGTVTRNLVTYRNLTLTYKLGCVPLMGPGSPDAYAPIVGARRTTDSAVVNFTIDADTVTATPVLDVAFLAVGTRKQLLWTGCTTDGKTVGFYIPNGIVTGARPVQMIDGEINRMKMELTASTNSAVTTNDLTLSAIRFFNG